MSQNQVFDLVVIGSGGGAKLVRPLANKGYRVAVIESGKWGGTCLNHGCIPSKMLIYPADVLREMGASESANLHGALPRMDHAALVARVTQTIDQESDHILPVYTQHPNVTPIEGHACLVGPHTVMVNGNTMEAPLIAIATGSSVRIPDLPGLSSVSYLTHKTALRLPTLPNRLVIIGGGYIALELAHYFSAAGSQVTVMTRGDILSGMMPELRERYRAMASLHVTFYTHATIQRVSQFNGEISVTLNRDGHELTVVGDALLVATGMAPNTDGLGLREAGIAHTDAGIMVNEYLETSVPGVVAFGDVIGPPYFRHKANYEGEYLVQSRFESPHPVPIVYPPMPYALFGHPALAGVGVLPSEVGPDVVIGKAEIRSSAYGMAMNRPDGMVVLLFDRSTRRLIGAHAVGHQAPTMIHMPVAFMKMNATLDDMLDTIYIHPSLVEVVRNAARQAAASW